MPHSNRYSNLNIQIFKKTAFFEYIRIRVVKKSHSIGFVPLFSDLFELEYSEKSIFSNIRNFRMYVNLIIQENRFFSNIFRVHNYTSGTAEMDMHSHGAPKS